MRRIATSALTFLALAPAAAQARRRLPELAALGTTANAQPVHQLYHRAAAVPDDPALTALDPASGTVLEWTAAKLDLIAAWAATPARTVRVAVIDSGADASRPDLSGNIVRAHDATLAGSDPRTDSDGHGTHVASLACARIGDGTGIAGAGGRACRLIVEKSDLTDVSIAAAIVDAVQHGAKVINMSFGGPGAASPLMRRAIAYAYKHDVVLVAAAADDPVADQGEPANLLAPSGNGLVVTAAAADGARASWAGFGRGVSVAAYGVEIFADFPANDTTMDRDCSCRTSLRGSSGFAYLSGTSMATPQVAGIAALVRAANPSLKARRVIRIVERSAGNSRSSDLGWGIPDAALAVRLAKAAR